MTTGGGAPSWNRYLFPRFLAGKVREKGVVWCLKVGMDKVNRRLCRFTRFLRRQARDIHEGGLPVLLRKVHAFLLMAPAVLVVLAVRALQPIMLIRFGWLRSNRIGHFAADTEHYLCERGVGMQDTRAVDIFYYYGSPVCNQQLKKMFDRTLRVSRFARSLDQLNRRLPGGEKHTIAIISRDVHHTRDAYGLLARTQVHFAFTPEEGRLGREGLQGLGISNGAPFVCFHSRDSSYLQNVFPNKDWRYHDYRDSNVKNFTPMAEELVRRGYFAVRMGAVVREPLQTTNPMIIDYATKGRNDFLDIFLGAHCRFFIGSASGINSIPTIFRRPIAWTNYVPLEHAPTWGRDDLFVLKKLWLREERRFLTFREILDSGVGRFLHSEQYEQLGIEVIENTPEEITAQAVEMDERLKGTWQTTEEDEELQRRFWSLFKPSELNGVFLSRIGAEFLRQNRELLD